MVYTLQDKDKYPKVVGIYKIYFANSINGKCYIGSSSSLNGKYSGVRTRWLAHSALLRRNKHYSKKLQNAYNKYGETNMIFELLEECSGDMILDRENFYIKELNCYRNGYNSRPTSNSHKGFKIPRYVIDKVNQTKRLKRIPYENDVLCLFSENKNASKVSRILGISLAVTLKILSDHDIEVRNGLYKVKRVYMYDINGNFISEWGSAKECADFYGYKSHATISHVASGKQISYKNHWFNYDKISKEEAVIKINQRILKGKKKMSNPDRLILKNIHQYDISGNLIKIWTTSRDIKEYYRIPNISPISAVFNGKKSHYKGYVWKKEEQVVKKLE